MSTTSNTSPPQQRLRGVRETLSDIRGEQNMRVTYQGMNSHNEELYFWIYIIGKINYDLNSTLILSHLLSKNQDKQSCMNTILYLSQQMYVHFNEAIKVFKVFDKNLCLERFLSEEFKNQEEYGFIMTEINFEDKSNNNNKFIKKFRDSSIHYKNLNFDSFRKVISEMRNEDIIDIDKHYPEDFNVELKSQIIHLYSNVILSGINVDEFAHKMNDISNSLMKFNDELFTNLINEIQKTIEVGKEI